MKYKNEKAKRIALKEKEIRKLNKRISETGRPNRWVKLEEPVQNGWDVYFEVAPAYRGTVLEDKIWEALSLVMRVGWVGENEDDEYGRGYYQKNDLGYSYSHSSEPDLLDLNEETLKYAKICHDLFVSEGFGYDRGGYGYEEYYYTSYRPNFKKYLVTVRVPCMVSEVLVHDELVAQEESELEARRDQLRNGVSPWMIGKSSWKYYKQRDNRRARKKGKMICRRITKETESYYGYVRVPIDETKPYNQFVDHVKDIGWWYW